MIPDNFITLIEKLKEKTEAGKAIWNRTSREEEFKLDLEKGAITIDNWQHPEDGEYLVDLVIFNDRGDKIDKIFYTASETEDYKYVIELHSLAKRTYYKVDDTFKSIFKELESDKIIGIESKNSEPPF